jgi:type II secretory pathway predicted ATPase ExeA
MYDEYEEYYGFVQPPFSLTPDPRFLYRSESHDVALQQVWQAIRRKEGFIVLTGDIGTGKTTLCRTLLEQFDPTTFTALILNPFLSIEELLREVLLSFGVVSKESMTSGRLVTASKHELIRTLHDFLLSLVPLSGSAVLIIDEAQHLSPEVLEEIRVLSNLETNEQKLLQIVLVGQLNLLELLRKSELRQLNQRVSIRCSLKPLTREEVEAYITHRLFVARGSTSVTFTPKSYDLVHALSSGIPRIINLVCDRALMAGRQAEVSKITEQHVRLAADALGLAVPKTRMRPELTLAAGGWRRRVAVGAAGLLALVAGGVVALGDPLDFVRDAALPPIEPAPRPVVFPGLAAVSAPTAMDVVVPPLDAGAFSVLVGTFDDYRHVTRVCGELRARGLSCYTLDLVYGEGDVRRRVLIGRFATREAAEEARGKIEGVVADARVIPGELERLRAVPR